MTTPRSADHTACSGEPLPRSQINWNLRRRDPILGIMLNESAFSSVCRAQGIDALIATTPKTFAYVSNFDCLGHHLINRSVCFAILPADRSHSRTLVFPHYDIDQYLESRSWDGSVRCYEYFYMFENDGPLPGEVGAVSEARKRLPCHDTPVEAVVSAIQDAGAATGRVGIETRGLKHSFVEALKAALPRCTLIEADDIWREIAMRKTSHEIQLIRKAAEINGRAIEDTARLIEPGVLEEDLSVYFKKRVYELGADPTFAIIKGGPESALVHMPASLYRLREGDVVRFDVGCIYSRYHADMGRTYSVGRATPEYRNIYDALRFGQEAVFKAAAPGVTPRSLLDAAVQAVRSAGLPHYNRSFIGHGIGAELYDLPLLTLSDSPRLEPGMCMNIEMGYYHFGLSGFQLEDPICITDSGCTVLSDLANQFELR